MNLLARRIPTIVGVVLLVAGGYWGWNFFSSKQVTETPEYVPSKVTITNVADNKFSVSWVTNGKTTGDVEYGLVGEKLDNLAGDDRDRNGERGSYLTHHVTVEGLQPNTSYAFRIISGQQTRYDNSGSPYSVTTGPTIAQTPTAHSIYGQIEHEGEELGDVLVYATLPGSAPASTLAATSGNYAISISTMRAASLNQYIEFDPSASVANLTLRSASAESSVIVPLAYAEPIPMVALGRAYDFRTQLPTVAQIESEEEVLTTNSPPSATTPTVFNIDPFAGSGNLGGTGGATLLNPGSEGEIIATTKPEFRGQGAPDLVISIIVQSSSSQADTVVVGEDGTWTWSPPAALSEGQHTITLAYIDLQGIEQTISRTFVVSTALANEGDPAFEATPSASTGTTTTTTTPTPSPTPAPSSNSNLEVSPSPTTTASIAPIPSPSPREVIPSTEGGVPVSGLLTPTLLTGVVGVVIMVLGAFLLAL